MGDLIQATELSNRLMGKRMGEYRPDKDFYAASTISHWRHPRARWAMQMRPEHLEQAGHVADDWVRAESGRGDVRFQMTVNSPWKCWLEIKFQCGHWERLDLRRRDNERCRECRDRAGR